MNRCLLLIALLFAAVAVRQDRQKCVGEIEVYGYVGLDIDKIRAALPLCELMTDGWTGTYSSSSAEARCPSRLHGRRVAAA